MLTKRLPLTIFTLLMFIIFLVGCNKNSATPPQNQPVNTAPIKTGAELVDTNCILCHTLDRVTRERDDVQWELHTQRMLEKSPEMFTEQEHTAVVTHLKEKY